MLRLTSKPVWWSPSERLPYRSAHSHIRALFRRLPGQLSIERLAAADFLPSTKARRGDGYISNFDDLIQLRLNLSQSGVVAVALDDSPLLEGFQISLLPGDARLFVLPSNSR